jgi:peptide/nickel transport system permease protein
MTFILGKGIDKIILALITFGWPDYARVIRSEVLAVKNQAYVSASNLMGATPLRAFFSHVLPNSIHPVIVLMSVHIGRIVLAAASMSFIGIGIEPGYADWGQMIDFARNWISGIPGDPFHYWYTYTYPSIAIFTFVLGWTFLGDAIRDVQDT